MNVQFKINDDRISKDMMKPSTLGSAGIDLHACINTHIWIKPHAPAILIPVGFSMNIGDPNVAALLMPRSSMGHKHGLVLGNCVGLIDSDYQGDVFVSLFNRSEYVEEILPMDRIAQMIFVPVIVPNFVEVEEFVESDRGTGGFGSTGK